MEYWERETSFIIPPIDLSKYNPLKKRKKKTKKKMENKIESDLTKHNYNNAQDTPHSLESTEVGERKLENESPPEQLDVKDLPNEDVLQPPMSEINENIPPYQPRPGAPYQLVFGMDDASSETSITSSPRSVESSNPLLGYLPELLPITNELSDDVSSVSLDVSSVSVDTVIEAQQSTALEHGVDTGSDITLALDSSSLTLGEEDVSVYSDSTVVADSTKELKSDEDDGKHDQMEEEMKSQSSGEVKLEDIQLQARSASATPPPRLKLHPISTNTGNSDAPLSPPYSPIEYVPDEDETEFGNIAILPPSPLPPGIDSPVPLDDQPSMSILFSGVTYLGSSSVDAPISETEANRKMIILKQQASASEPIPIVLSIPTSNDGTVYLKDPETDHPLTTFPVKMILFCARGNMEDYFDCFCLNVRHKRSGIYHCHVFRCEIIEACHKIFEAIGRAFKTVPLDPASPELTPELTSEFDVTFEIQEDDGKGNYVLVPMDKDCFKLRQNTRKKVVLSVAQPTTSKPMVVERCFGLLISPGKDVKQSEMNLLDNMNCSNTDGIFTVAGFWDVGVPFLTPLNEETSKSTRHRHMTIAADLVLEGVTEPVRFKRELKIQVSKGDSLGYFVSTLSKRKHPTETFILTLKRSLESTTKNMMYSIVELKNAREVKVPPTQSNSSQSPASPGDGGPEKDSKPQLIPAEEVTAAESSTSMGVKKQKKARAEHNGDSDNSQAVDEYEEEYLVSGWGEMDDMREDLFKDWGELLDKWDGKEKARPKQLIKLCRKGIPRHLRCQVWQLLSGAAYDPQLYESYRLLISKESPTENVINWDIKRTYVGHEYFKDGLAKDALYKINKAYSVYDEEVGYCQGFSFMVAVLLLQKMPEEQAFNVFVKIMYNYGHRDVFRNDFRNLHLMFYQLDRLMEEHLSDLHQHFHTQRVETHMFASQWFLTLYTAKFPLVVVFRILDNFLCERTPVLFQVALGLLKLARKDLMALDFEGILNYFRVSLPRKFQSEEDCKHLFHTVFHFKIKDSKLKKLEKDYQFHLEQVAQEEDPVNRFQHENKQLRDTIIRLEQENDNLAQELVTSKVTLRAEMDKLEERIDTLSKEARASKTNTEVAQQQISELKEEVQQAKEEYQKVMMQLMEDRLHHEGAISEYKELFQRLDQGHQKQKEELNQELIEVKAQLGSLGEVPADADSAQHLSSLSSEQRLRNLELELARTKLALVESQCKNQELEHKVEGVTSGQVHSKGRNWFDFSKKK